MKYSFLLLIVGVFFSRCAEWEKGKELPLAETLSLDNLFKIVKKLDTSAIMPGFKADTVVFPFQSIFLEEYYPDPVPGLKGNVVHIRETRVTPAERGRPSQEYVTEYFFENGLPVLIIDTNEASPHTQMLKYDTAGRLIENKEVNGDESDSTAMEYQYDAANKLSKILHFDALNKLVRTTYFYYHRNGNLDSVLDMDTEGTDYIYRYFTSSASNSALEVKTGKTGIIESATFYKLLENGVPGYSEQYRNDGSIFLGFNKYEYNAEGYLAKDQMWNYQDKSEYYLRYSFKNKDARGNWIEMLLYVTRDLNSITRRTITYK